MLSVSKKQFLLWEKKQLLKGGNKSSLYLLLDLIADISLNQLCLIKVNKEGNLYLKKNLEFIESMWDDHIRRSIPIQYLCGFTYWRDMKLMVSDKVLIPRPETELIVDIVHEIIERNNQKLFFAELGTGSGAVSIALSILNSSWKGIATDIDKDAIDIA